MTPVPTGRAPREALIVNYSFVCQLLLPYAARRMDRASSRLVILRSEKLIQNPISIS